MTKQREKTEAEVTEILERLARGEITYISAQRRLRWGYSQLIIELEQRGLRTTKGAPVADEQQPA